MCGHMCVYGCGHTFCSCQFKEKLELQYKRRLQLIDSVCSLSLSPSPPPVYWGFFIVLHVGYFSTIVVDHEFHIYTLLPLI
jgi:hypothetical protein